MVLSFLPSSHCTQRSRILNSNGYWKLLGICESGMKLTFIQNFAGGEYQAQIYSSQCRINSSFLHSVHQKSIVDICLIFIGTCRTQCVLGQSSFRKNTHIWIHDLSRLLFCSVVDISLFHWNLSHNQVS